tara:strand:- start:18899 stop:19198 length:300 start_codon:yes stop_codon:yes gene_type:complete
MRHIIVILLGIITTTSIAQNCLDGNYHTSDTGKHIRILLDDMDNIHELQYCTVMYNTDMYVIPMTIIKWRMTQKGLRIKARLYDKDLDDLPYVFYLKEE